MKKGGTASLFFVWIFAISAVALGSGETYKDIIEKAQNLSIQHERLQAIQILIKSIQKEGKRNPAPKELFHALEEVSTVFYSDKAQQLFELAISFRSGNPALALQKLGEAARLEPDNLQIDLEQVRLNLILKECSKAESSMGSLAQQFPYLEAVQLAGAQVALCQNQSEKAALIKSGVDLQKSALLIFWHSSEAEHQLRLGQPQKVLETSLAMRKIDPAFPETNYWQWRAETDLKLNPEKSAQGYLNSCKTLSARKYREYLAEPTICRRVAEVEAAVKKSSTTEVK